MWSGIYKLYYYRNNKQSDINWSGMGRKLWCVGPYITLLVHILVQMILFWFTLFDYDYFTFTTNFHTTTLWIYITYPNAILLWRSSKKFCQCPWVIKLRRKEGGYKIVGHRRKDPIYIHIMLLQYLRWLSYLRRY